MDPSLKRALRVFCPTCLAKPGDYCRSIMPWTLGKQWGSGSECRPHLGRRRAASGFRVVGEEGNGKTAPNDQADLL